MDGPWLCSIRPSGGAPSPHHCLPRYRGVRRAWRSPDCVQELQPQLQAGHRHRALAPLPIFPLAGSARRPQPRVIPGGGGVCSRGGAAHAAGAVERRRRRLCGSTCSALRSLSGYARAGGLYVMAASLSPSAVEGASAPTVVGYRDGVLATIMLVFVLVVQVLRRGRRGGMRCAASGPLWKRGSCTCALPWTQPVNGVLMPSWLPSVCCYGSCTELVMPMRPAGRLRGCGFAVSPCCRGAGPLRLPTPSTPTPSVSHAGSSLNSAGANGGGERGVRRGVRGDDGGGRVPGGDGGEVLGRAPPGGP